ncbi:hypothetical protein ABBQ38_011431 [Trebouxia sp. C0009 RCD-2024]
MPCLTLVLSSSRHKEQGCPGKVTKRGSAMSLNPLPQFFDSCALHSSGASWGLAHIQQERWQGREAHRTASPVACIAAPPSCLLSHLPSRPPSYPAAASGALYARQLQHGWGSFCRVALSCATLEQLVHDTPTRQAQGPGARISTEDYAVSTGPESRPVESA